MAEQHCVALRRQQRNPNGRSAVVLSVLCSAPSRVLTRLDAIRNACSLPDVGADLFCEERPRGGTFTVDHRIPTIALISNAQPVASVKVRRLHERCWFRSLLGSEMSDRCEEGLSANTRRRWLTDRGSSERPLRVGQKHSGRFLSLMTVLKRPPTPSLSL